jgi:hypothetical protein
MDSPPTFDRRQLLKGGLLFSVAAAAGVIWLRIANRDATPSGPLTAAQRQMLQAVCDLTVPNTDTPGAVAVGVPAFVELALIHGLAGTVDFAKVLAIVSSPTDQRGGLIWLDQLGEILDAKASGAFGVAPKAEQEAALSAIDAEAFASGDSAAPWRKIKTLILIGYYTSEIGASTELRYELTPGRWANDVLLTPEMRAFSSDWTAVQYG